jgi:hypothetical protein
MVRSILVIPRPFRFVFAESSWRQSYYRVTSSNLSTEYTPTFSYFGGFTDVKPFSFNRKFSGASMQQTNLTDAHLDE